MKNTAKLLTVLVGVMLAVAMVGCPKKVVKEEPILPPPDTTTEVPVTPKLALNLGTIHFDFDKSDIRSGDAKILDVDGNQLLDAAKQDVKPMVTIEGYCDPVGTSEYNMALGQRRAESAKSYLVKLGVPAGQFSTISYGEEKLVTTEEAKYEQNRRCEFKVAE
jgi:peptidoglycan-associated lipoprotein